MSNTIQQITNTLLQADIAAAEGRAILRDLLVESMQHEAAAKAELSTLRRQLKSAKDHISELKSVVGEKVTSAHKDVAIYASKLITALETGKLLQPVLNELKEALAVVKVEVQQRGWGSWFAKETAELIQADTDQVCLDDAKKLEVPEPRPVLGDKYPGGWQPKGT